MISLDIPVHPFDKVEKFIAGRIKAYKSPPFLPCSAEDRWCKTTYAVMETGKKRALTNGVKSTKAEAEQYQRECGVKNTYIDVREGTNLRCEEYCPVNKFCDFGKKLLDSKI
jgi:hypothetical protein